MVATARHLKLDRSEVQKLIDELLPQENIDGSMLFAFAEKINGAKFKEPKVAQKTAMTITEARKAVLDTFGCKTATDLKKNETFSMPIAGENYGLKTKVDFFDTTSGKAMERFNMLTIKLTSLQKNYEK